MAQTPPSKSSPELRIEIPDPLVKRNYLLLRHHLISLVDTGLDFLRKEYLKANSGSPFQEFTATNYYDYILKDYIRRKIKTQIRVVVNSAVQCVSHLIADQIDSAFLDQIVAQNYKEYAFSDMSLLHSSPFHPLRGDLEAISKLTFRVITIQATRILNNHTPDISTYSQLIQTTYPSRTACNQSLRAILSMMDEMIDCFERSLTLIQIPFYKPAWAIRDFSYIRKLYEFALKVLNDYIDRIYDGEAF